LFSSMPVHGVLIACAASASLLGCTSVGHRLDDLEQCRGREAHWRPSQEAPANQLQLLELDSGGQPVRERLMAGVVLKEAWFTDGPNRLMLCRFEEGTDVCPVALTVEFTRNSTSWTAGSVQSRVCAE